jgi:general secretion pathway protein J
VSSHATRRRSGGFTLLELLVAMFIAAIIFAMGYGTINQAVKNRTGLQEQQKKLLELQTTVRTMEQDFVQLVQRPIRDPVGGTYQACLVANATSSTGSRSSLGGSSSSLGGSSSSLGGSSSSLGGSSSSLGGSSSSLTSNGVQPIVALTRGGWTNPTGLQRTALQRVAYYFQDGTLRREYWTVLDPTQTSTPVRRDLMTHLKSVSLRYLDVQAGQVQVQGQSQNLSQNGNWSPIWPPLNGANQNNLRYRPIAVEITLETEDWGKIVRIVEIAG